MTTEHTPQWEADSTWVRMGEGVVATIIRVIPDAATDDELLADARKIAAVPDMLNALMMVREGTANPRGYIVSAAIAKARGTSEPITN